MEHGQKKNELASFYPQEDFVIFEIDVITETLLWTCFKATNDI
jgi:hypothetical protein